MRRYLEMPLGDKLQFLERMQSDCKRCCPAFRLKIAQNG